MTKIKFASDDEIGGTVTILIAKIKLTSGEMVVLDDVKAVMRTNDDFLHIQYGGDADIDTEFYAHMTNVAFYLTEEREHEILGVDPEEIETID